MATQRTRRSTSQTCGVLKVCVGPPTPNQPPRAMYMRWSEWVSGRWGLTTVTRIEDVICGSVNIAGLGGPPRLPRHAAG